MTAALVRAERKLARLTLDGEGIIGSRERARHKAKILRATHNVAKEKRIAMFAARWARKAHGRISDKEARELGERSTGYYGMPDWIAQREPGDFARRFAEAKDNPNPKRVAEAITYIRDWTSHNFYWYGPNDRRWPGDSLVWDPTVPGPPCSQVPGAWVIKRGNG